MQVDLVAITQVSMAVGVVMLLLAALIAGWRRRVVPDIGQTIEHSRLMLSLARQMQQHRGMSSAWLAGDASFMARMQPLQRAIESDMNRLVETFSSIPVSTSVSVADLQRWRGHWRELVSSLKGKSLEDSIARHTFLISSLLDWLSAYGESALMPALDESGKRAARNLTHRLPAVTEALGQARAIGSSVAALRGCSPVARVRLLFLVSRAETLVQQSTRESAASTETRARERAERAVAEMVRTIRSSMLMGMGVSVSADDYFNLATRAIDAVFDWVEACRSGLVADEAHMQHGRIMPVTGLS